MVGRGFVVKTNRPKKKPKFTLMTFDGDGKKLPVHDRRSDNDNVRHVIRD